MADAVAPEFARFIDEERRASRLPASRGSSRRARFRTRSLSKTGASEFLRVAPRRAVGLFRPSNHTEVVWMHGDSELAVSLVELTMRLADGLLAVLGGFCITPQKGKISFLVSQKRPFLRGLLCRGAFLSYRESLL
jgi:hypothetical protein